MSRQELLSKRRQTHMAAEDAEDLARLLKETTQNEQLEMSAPISTQVEKTPSPTHSNTHYSPTSQPPPVFPSRINISRRETEINNMSPKTATPSSPFENRTPLTVTTQNGKEGTITRIYRKFTTLLKPNFLGARREALRFIPDRKPPANPTSIVCEDIEEFALVVQERAAQSMLLHKLSIMYMKMRSKKEDSIDTPTITASPLDDEIQSSPSPSKPLKRTNSDKKEREYFEERLIEVTRSKHLLVYRLTNQIRAQLPNNPPIDYEKCYSLSEDFNVHSIGLTQIKLKGGKTTQAYVITITFMALYTLTFAVTSESEYQDWLDVFRLHVMRNIAIIESSTHISTGEDTDLKVIEEYNMLVEQKDEWIRMMGETRYAELIRNYAETIV
jgi:hypothetical protein